MVIKTSTAFFVPDEEGRVRIRFTDFCSGPVRRLSGGLVSSVADLPAVPLEDCFR